MLEKTVWLFAFALVLSTACFSAQPVNLPRAVTLMNLSEQAKQRLLRDGILVIVDWKETNLWKAYDDMRRFHGVPIFVTTDACLYQFYELHKAAVREAETQRFLPLLHQLVRDWAAISYKVMSSEKAVKESEHAAFILAVAGKLLDDKFPVPDQLKTQVDALVREIVLAQRVVEGEPFGEDFTQYKPRGHYAANEELQRYFRAFKWLARRVYDAQKIDQLRQAAHLLWLLEQTPNGLERYRIFMNAITSLSGEPVGIPLTELHQAIRAIGRQTNQVLSDYGSLEALRNELTKPEYGQARIVTHPVPAVVFPPPQLMPEKQIRPLPEIQLPDSEVLQWTSDPQVLGRIPSGLDVAASLGSQRAIELLRQTLQGELVLERIKPFAQTWAQLSDEDWKANVYRLWLWAIKALFEIDEQTPKFMQTQVWQDWKLNSALASWAQLRHAYGLYAAPVYMYAGMEFGIPPAYLEPNPKCYERLAIATEKLREVLSEAKALSERMDSHLRKFANLMRQFVAIAEKERRGEALSESEAKMLAFFSEVITDFPRETPVTVIDIATHSQTGQVLHVASGKLHPVLIVVEEKPYKPFIAAGWSLSYYEFTRPNFERMTDADWEKWLDRDIARPEPPFWAYSFQWSSYEDLEGFADLRRGESLLATNSDEGIRLLRQVAQKHEGTWVGAKAHLLLARHFVEAEKFEEAQRELEGFYRSANMRLLREADEIYSEAQWEWEQWARRQKAQPYLQRLLQLTEPPKKPLTKAREQRRQDLRAKTLLLQLIELLPLQLRQQKVAEIVEQILRECPQSRFIPAAKAVLWWYKASVFDEALPTKQQFRRIVDEALKIINEHPSSVAAWFVASEMVEDLFVEGIVELEDAKRLSDAISKLKPLRRGWETSEEATLLEVLIPEFSITDLTRQPSIDHTILARLYLREGNLEGAWEVMRKAGVVDEELQSIFEAWKREGKEVATLLMKMEQARKDGDFGAMLQICETFVQKFPKSRWTASILWKAIEACWQIGEDDKAKTLEKQLLSQFPKSSEAKWLLKRQREREQIEQERMKAAENFLLNLLKGTKIDLTPYLTVAKTDLPSALDKLIEEHPELKEQVVREVLNALEKMGKEKLGNEYQAVSIGQFMWLLRAWLLDRFCERYRSDPLAYEVRWRLQIEGMKEHLTLNALPLLAPFLYAAEGAPYRDEAEKLLERVLAKRPKRTAEYDPFFQLLECAEQFLPLKPRLLLTAGEWAMEDRDWETAKRLLTQAANEGDEKVRKKANELLTQLEHLRHHPQKFAKRLWEMDLWQLYLPSPQKAEDCFEAIVELSGVLELIREADTDGKWLAMETHRELICVNLSTGEIVWRKPFSWLHNFVVSNTVIWVTSAWQPRLGEVREVTAMDAASGKTLWKRKFTGERIIFGKLRDKFAFAQWREDEQEGKGKLVLLNPRTGKQESEQPLDWQEFLNWQERLQSDRRDLGKAFLTDEQGRLIAMWICEKYWRTPDGTTIIVLFPNGKLAAYSASQ